MMTEKIKTAFRRILQDEARLMGLLFGVLAFVVILSGILASPRLGTVDSGKYEKIMETAGLGYTEKQEAEGDLLYVKVMETYDYTHFSYAKLFAPNGNSSLLYPIAIIRLLTQPFGLGFSTLYLYLMYAALAALAVAVIVKSAAYTWGRSGVIPGIILVLLFSDRNLTAYFGSLYETGTLIVALLLFFACVCRGLTYCKGAGMSVIWPTVLSSMFLLNAGSRAVIFIPMVLIVLAGLAVSEWSFASEHYHIVRVKKLPVAVIAILMICSVYSSVGYFNTDPDNTSRTAVYHSVFQGILPASKDPEGDLKELGLDASYADDIGKSFYLDQSEYAHDPKLEEEAEAIFGAVDTKKVALWHLRHPVRSMNTVMKSVSGMNIMESGWTLSVGHDTRSDRKVFRSNSVIATLGKMILPKGYGFLIFTAALLILLAAGLWIFRVYRKKDRKTRWVEPAIIISAALSIAFYLPLHIILMGTDSLEFDRIASVFFLIAAWGGLLMAAGHGIAVCSAWFRKIYGEEKSELVKDTVTYRETRRSGKLGSVFAKWARTIAGSRRNTVLAVLVLAVIMVGSIQFAAPRAGSVNNGDFGRMMEQLDLTWTGDVFYDLNAQLGHHVIEEYEYRADFDPSKLTSLRPTYSLVYPVDIVRGICKLFGVRFSTWYVSILMSVILLLCIMLIVWDLYKYFKKYTILMGIGFCLIFLCESSLVWFNSLFGEGSILLGVMMVLACCIHLSVLPQGKGAPWVFALAFAAMFLTTAKAQMMVALPVVLMLVIVFAFYHRPLRIGRLVVYMVLCMICVSLIGYKGIRIYQDNSHVSERQTVWQSVFYGALMISDDPLGDMEELGIPQEMAADIGKDAYQPDEEYVISPNSGEADAALYDRVNTFTMVGYYLKRPLKLMQMLDYSAGQSQEVYNEFRAYIGQNYSGTHDEVDRWGVWLYWRPLFALGHFWEYVLVYGAILIYAIYLLRKKDLSASKKLLVVSFLGIMLVGALQFPLTSIGNGFADNHKQLFGFMICHDLMLLLGFPVLLSKSGEIKVLIRRLKKRFTRVALDNAAEL